MRPKFQCSNDAHVPATTSSFMDLLNESEVHTGDPQLDPFGIDGDDDEVADEEVDDDVTEIK